MEFYSRKYEFKLAPVFVANSGMEVEPKILLVLRWEINRKVKVYYFRDSYIEVNLMSKCDLDRHQYNIELGRLERMIKEKIHLYFHDRLYKIDYKDCYSLDKNVNEIEIDLTKLLNEFKLRFDSDQYNKKYFDLGLDYKDSFNVV